MSVQLDKDLRILNKKLNLVKKAFKKDEYKRVLAAGATIAQEAIKSEAPQGETSPHVIKDGSGKTKTVKAGNLKKSVQVFQFKKSTGVFAGPITSKKSKVKKVPGAKKLTRRHRAFYWRFVYYGAYRRAANPFIQRAKSKSKGAVLSKLKQETKRFLPKNINKIFD